jgi:hypothetical protein
MRSWRKKLVFSLVATLGFFLLLEMGLRLVGIHPVTDTHDPFAGFSQLPLLVPIEGAHGEQLLTTAPSKLVWFNSQTFPRQKLDEHHVANDAAIAHIAPSRGVHE